MWRSFAPRRLFLSSLHSSSSSTISCPRLVPSSIFSSSSNYSSHAPPFSGRKDEESRNVRVSVWWDLHACNLPTGVDVSKVAPTINATLRANGIKGPMEIYAFGDVLGLQNASGLPIHYTGITFNDVIYGGRFHVDRDVFYYLLCWAAENPPPAHLFLISNYGDCIENLHRLRMENYNILVASRRTVEFGSVASIMWDWDSLIRGEILMGKHFKYPPNDSYGSWYGCSN